MQLISVIIPTFNRAHRVAQAIQSVLDQSYRNLEIIVVDDGSFDNTPNIISKFGNKVRYFRKQNGGVSSARNYGICHCTGELIAFLDSDDTWMPEKLEKQYAYLDQHPDFGMVLCDCFFVDARGERTGISNRRSVLPHDGNLLRDVLLAPSLIPSSVLVHKELLFQVDLFDETICTAEDLDLHMRLARLTKIGLIAEPLFNVLRGEDGLSILSRTYDDHVFVVERFVQQFKNEISSNLQREVLFNTYVQAANGMFWHGKLFSGFRYGIQCCQVASGMNLNAVSSMWLSGIKASIKHIVKHK